MREYRMLHADQVTVTAFLCSQYKPLEFHARQCPIRQRQFLKDLAASMYYVVSKNLRCVFGRNHLETASSKK